MNYSHEHIKNSAAKTETGTDTDLAACLNAVIYSMATKGIKRAFAGISAGLVTVTLWAYKSPAQPSPSASVFINSYQFQSCVGNSRYEIDYKLPFGYILTGIGVRAHSDEIRTVRLIARQIRPDGSLGPREEFRTGPAKDADVELMVEAPPGNAIINIGANIDRRGPASQDFKYLMIQYRPIGRTSDGRLALNGPIRTSWANNVQGPLEATCRPDVAGPENSPITGIAMRESGDSLTGLGIYYGQLK